MDKKVKKRLLWAVLFSTGFMFILLGKVDWRHFSLITSRLDIKYFISSWCVFVSGNFIRALRFHKLDHTGNRLLHWWDINAFYNITTATLPGGAGEAATAYILKRFSMFNLLGAFRILFLSRLLDLFTLSALFFVGAVFIDKGTPHRETAILISGALFLMSLAALLPSSEQFIIKIVNRLPGQNKLVRGLCEKLSDLLAASVEQRNKKTYNTILFQSVVMMVAGVISVYLLLRSFGIDFTPVQSVYCYGIYMIFQIVPVQGIAGIGTQPAWWALALHTAGYGTDDAIEMGFILHGSLYCFIIFIGIISLLPWVTRKIRINWF